MNIDDLDMTQTYCRYHCSQVKEHLLRPFVTREGINSLARYLDDSLLVEERSQLLMAPSRIWMNDLLIEHQDTELIFPCVCRWEPILVLSLSIFKTGSCTTFEAPIYSTHFWVYLAAHVGNL